jgi:hypothetical protein
MTEQEKFSSMERVRRIMHEALVPCGDCGGAGVRDYDKYCGMMINCSKCGGRSRFDAWQDGEILLVQAPGKRQCESKPEAKHRRPK